MALMLASQLIKKLREHVGHGYVYGAVGQTCTINLLKSKQLQYGSAMGEGYYQLNGDYTKGKCAKWIGKWVADCSGLIRACRRDSGFGDVSASAQGVFDQCQISRRGTTKRTIILPNTKWNGEMPMVPGCAVFMYSATKRRMSHVGIYVGNGKVIESMGVGQGVVITDFAKRGWQAWGLLAWVQYDLSADGTQKPGNDKEHEGSPIDPEDLPVLRLKLVRMKGDKVKLLQQLLVKKGLKLAVDGIFGKETDAKVKAFQRAHKLIVDGIVGIQTWTELLK